MEKRLIALTLCPYVIDVKSSDSVIWGRSLFLSVAFFGAEVCFMIPTLRLWTLAGGKGKAEQESLPALSATMISRGLSP